jgi:hypothetical protein
MIIVWLFIENPQNYHFSIQIVKSMNACRFLYINKINDISKFSASVVMLLLGLLESDRPSLRAMEDIFNSRRFKFLFNVNQKVSVKYNSILERLSVMDVDFFEQYYSQLTQLYSSQEILQNKIIRVDLTRVHRHLPSFQQE